MRAPLLAGILLGLLAGSPRAEEAPGAPAADPPPERTDSSAGQTPGREQQPPSKPGEAQLRQGLKEWQKTYDKVAGDESRDRDTRDNHAYASQQMDRVRANLDKMHPDRKAPFIANMQKVWNIASDIEKGKGDKEALTNSFWEKIDELASTDTSAPSSSQEADGPQEEPGEDAGGESATPGQIAAAAMAQKAQDIGVGGPSGISPASGQAGGGSASGGGASPSLGFSRKLAEVLPNDSHVRSQYAAELLKAGDPKNAAVEAKAAVRLNPSNAGGQSVLARAEFQLGDYAAAQESAQKALRLDPRRSEAMTVLKLADGRAGPSAARAPEPGRRPEASPSAEGTPFFSTPAPGSPRDRAFIETLRRQASRQAAGEGARPAVRLVGEAARLLSEGDYAAALALSREAVSLDPDNDLARYYMTMALIRQGRLQEALRAVDEALSRSPSSARLLVARSNVMNLLKRPDEALRDAEAALRLDEGNAEAWVNKAWALDAMGRRSEALSCLAKAADIDPKYMSLRDQAQKLKPGEIALVLSGGEPRPARASTDEPVRGAPSGPRLVFTGVAALAGIMLIAWGFLKRESSGSRVRL